MICLNVADSVVGVVGGFGAPVSSVWRCQDQRYELRPAIFDVENCETVINIVNGLGRLNLIAAKVRG